MKFKNIVGYSDATPIVFAITPLIIMGTDFVIRNFAHTLLNSNFFMNLLVEVIGAGIGVYVAIFLYRKAIRNDSEKEAIKRESETDELLLYSKNQISQGKQWIHDQVELMESFSSEVDANFTSFPKIFFNPSQAFVKLDKLFSNTVFYHGYLSKFGSSDEMITKYNKIEDCIDYFVNVRNQAMQMRSEAIAKYNNRVYQIKDQLRELYEYMVAVIEEDVASDISQLLIPCIKKLQTLEKTDFGGAIVDVLIPLRSEIIRSLTKSSKGTDIINKVDRVKVNLDEVELNMRGLANDYRMLIDHFQQMNSKLVKVADDISQFKQD